MVKYEEVEGRLVCYFEGRMDTVASMKIEDDVFDQVLRRRLPTVFDLKEVTFVSSAFFRICLKAARATNEMKITMINTPPLVREGFRITGLDAIMDVK
ncbi:MAG: STAS domain-containing protein [Victivallales bacterium]